MEKNKNSGELIYSLGEINKAVELLNKLTQKYPIIALSGHLGAGKTTLVQNFLKSQDIKEPVLSPTFTYFNQYKISNKINTKNFYHFDLYRLSGLEEFISLGFDELIYEPNSVSLIEWPEIIESLLEDKSVCRVYLDYFGFDKRIITYNCSKIN